MLDPAITLYEAYRIKAFRQPIRSDLGEGDLRKPQVGDIAWVIEIYEDSPGYELECSDRNGITEWMQALAPGEIVLEKVVTP